jgi:parallel beta-helix repeat protein
MNHPAIIKTLLLKTVFHIGKITFQLWTVSLFTSGFVSNAQSIYVDKQLSANCNGNYSVMNRNCNGSDGDAYATLQSAAAAAVAGTKVLIREGEYNEQLNPGNSGSENQYITFRNFENEVVEITGESLSPAIWIERKDYIIIEGLKVHDVRRWLNALGSSYIIIRNNEFEKALDEYGSSKTGIFMQSCSHVRILDNMISESTQDNIGLIDCAFNLIEGNTVTRAAHTLWALKCSNYNVIRGNYFHNELQKIGEIYDCHNAGYGEGDFPKLYSYDDSKYNVVEQNTFAYTPSPVDRSPYAGIQYAGQHGIIRNNIFYECEGPPLDLTIYSEEATNNYSNRISHNVFYNNEFGGISISGNEEYSFGDQRIKNNIIYRNKFVQRDFRWSWYSELNNKPVQIFTGRDSDILFEGNNIFNSEEDELYVIAFGSRFSSSNEEPKPLSWWEMNYSEEYKNNMQTDPMFVDELNKDFHLLEQSPMIDAGTFLTTTTSSATHSTMMAVDDAGWFMDGFGIVAGDTIQIEGQTEYSVIQSVNYGTKTLILNSALSWETGQGVSLKYDQSAPDIGAYEFRSKSSGTDYNFSYNLDVEVMPNPTCGAFRIELPNNELVEKITIYNSSGKRVRIAYYNEVNISDLDKGIYLVEITSGNCVLTTGKIVKY